MLEKAVWVSTRESGTARDNRVKNNLFGNPPKEPNLLRSQLLGKQPFGELRNPPVEK